MAGRVCLIKSVLSALLIYYLPFFKVPKSVRSSLKFKEVSYGDGINKQENNMG